MTNIFDDLVAFFGGQKQTAKALGVSQGTVSGWTRSVHGCSAEKALFAQELTGGRFSASQLRPSLAKSLSTLNQKIRAIPATDQSANPAVNSSSASKAPR